MELGRTASPWTLEVQPVVSADPIFAEWCFHRVHSILGNSPQPTPTPRLEGHMAMLLMSIEKIAAVADKLTNSQGVGADGAKVSKPTLYSEYTVAALKGCCRIRYATHLPPIWALFQNTKDMEDHSLNLQQWMTGWAQQEGIKIDSGVFFTKDTIKDIVELRPNPAEGYASLQTAEIGVSILVCLPRSPTDIEALRIWESAAEESKSNRTLAEAIKMGSATSCSPAANALELKLNIATYLSLLWALFGETSHLYQKVYQVYNMQCLPAVMAAKHAYTSLLCRQITWLIYDDLRNFFSKHLHPNDFATGRLVTFPLSLLNNIMWDICFGRPVVRFSFTVEWSKAVVQGAKTEGTGGPAAPTVLNAFARGDSGGSTPTTRLGQ